MFRSPPSSPPTTLPPSSSSLNNDFSKKKMKGMYSRLLRLRYQVQTIRTRTGNELPYEIGFEIGDRLGQKRERGQAGSRLSCSIR